MSTKKVEKKPRTMSAARRRTDLTSARIGGLVRGNALAELRSRFRTPESMASFLEWRKHPVTMLFIDSLRELSLNPGVFHAEFQDPSEELGLTTGLQTAHALLDDPSSLFNELFLGATPDAGTMPDAEYTHGPDGQPMISSSENFGAGI